MKDAIRSRINQLLQNGYSIDPGGLIASGFQLAGKGFWPLFGFSVGVAVLGTLLSLVPTIGVLVVQFVINPIFLASILLMIAKVHRGESIRWDDLVKGAPKATQLILFTFLYTFILVLVLLPTIYALYNSGFIEFMMEVMENPTMAPEDLAAIPPINAGLVLLNILPLIYLMISFWWGPFLIVFHDLSFFQALENSRRLVTKRWFSHFILGILLFLLLMGLSLGVMVLTLIIPQQLTLIGIILSGLLQVIYLCIQFVNFHGVVGTETVENADLDVTDHLIDP